MSVIMVVATKPNMHHTRCILYRTRGPSLGCFSTTFSWYQRVVANFPSCILGVPGRIHHWRDGQSPGLLTFLSDQCFVDFLPRSETHTLTTKRGSRSPTPMPRRDFSASSRRDCGLWRVRTKPQRRGHRSVLGRGRHNMPYASSSGLQAHKESAKWQQAAFERHL